MQVRPLVLAAGVVAVGVVGPLLAAGSASAATGATVTVVHGIPKTPVDVYVDGKRALADFRFTTVTPPLSLRAGGHALAVRSAGAAAAAAPLLTATANLTAGANVTVVAHLTAAGKPTLTPYVNTVTTPAGKGRIVVRHTAAAPAVDVRAGGTVVVSGLTNPQSRNLTLAPGRISADVVLAGTSSPVIGPVPLQVTAGMTTVVYAIGSASGGTLTAVTQRISAMPQSVPAGSGGAAADPGRPVLALSVTLLAGLALAGTSGRRLLRTRVVR